MRILILLSLAVVTTAQVFPQIDKSTDLLNQPCWREKSRIQTFVFGSSPKYITNEHVPLCDAVGMYEPMQCSDGQCWCVTKCGMEIPNTRKTGPVTCSESLLATYSAPCTSVSEILGYTPACDSNGFFQPKQCNVDECWCITLCGQEVTETRTPISQVLDCNAVMQINVQTNTPIITPSSCADGSTPLNCDQQNICNQLSCSGYPSAICRPNTCKGCIIEWFNSDKIKLTCTDDKAGRCPAFSILAPVDQSECSFRCNSDADCSGAHKCCSTGCGTKCAVAKMEKWGSCPASKSFLDKTCTYRCTSDFDCLGDEKCCSNGCGKVCTGALRPAKVGTCPSPKTFGLVQSNCAVQCGYDQECSSTQKCCNTECGTTCSEPVSMKTPTLLRVCPAVLPEITTCSRACQSTADCGAEEACCTTSTCGRQCITAITFKAAPRPCDAERKNTPTRNLGGATVSLQGVHTPTCGSGGYHNPKQCDSTTGICWCVTACGTPIQGTHTSGPLTCRYDEPPCRKEYQQLRTVGFGSRQLYCRQDGFYESRQCHGSVCWCVDRCGNEIQGTKGARNTVRCECPGNEHAWLCNSSPCDSTTCEAYPSATCRVNFCSGCTAEFYVNDVKVECDTPKNGVCPIADHVRLPQECTNECMTDSSCAGTKKCCEYGCSTICVSAEPQLKNGQCPAIPADYYGSCTSECSADRDCTGKAKCCYNGCGRICMLPQQQTFVGQCPFPWVDISTCTGYSSSCVHNGDCPTNQKCCESGCGKQCVAAEGVTTTSAVDTNNAVVTTNSLSEKTGMCPAQKYLACSYVQECVVDSDCTGTSKCCNNGCGFVCTGPWTSNKYGYCPRASIQDVLTNVAACTADMDCPGDRKCCNIDATQKACVNVWEKVTNGQCPTYTSQEVTSCVYSNECSTDVDCLMYGTNRKCCSTPCGGTKCKIADVYPSCMYKGKQYVHQDFWSPDSCTICKCWSGATRCTQRKCPAYDSTKCQAVYRDGQCCPDVYCQSENIIGQTPVKCTDQQGLSYQNGDVWFPDSCSECQCNEGHVECSAYKCFTEPPRNTTGCKVTTVPGRCCPDIKCQDTCVDHSGNIRYENDQWSIEDCVTCRCTNGQVNCVNEVCPSHHDASCELRKVKGQCCPDVFCPVTINPSRMCVDGTKSYGEGSEFTRGACEKCLCMNRVINCQRIECAADSNPLLANCLKVNIEGRCCPEIVCNQQAGVCNHEGNQYYDSETWQPDTCTLCTCEKGVTRCNVMSCPPIKQGCTAQFIDGKCCPEITCQSSAVTALCFHEGIWRSEGDTWNQGRCDVCNCVDGVVTCNPMTCPQVQASAGCHVVQHNGFCCPVKVCRGSETQCVTPELTIANGENYTISNPLPAESGHTWSSPMTVTERAHCTCNMGRLTCTRSACPVAQDPCTTETQAVGAQGCPSITCPYVKPGVCPIPRPGSVGSCDQQCTQDSDCQGATKCCSNGCGTACTNAWRAGCVDEVGTERTSGDIWYQDLCTICNCVNNQSICEEQQCAEVPPGCSIKLVAGQCCGEVVCQPSTTAQVATCDYEGQNYMPGNTWIVDDCTTCRCDNGRTVCDTQTCPKTSNYGCRMLYVSGKCCPEKICKEPKSCLYDGVYYLNSEKFYVSACEECECLNGIVSCKNETCPTPTGLCTYEVPVGVNAEFSCCMNITCPLTAPGQTCLYNGKVYNYNEVFMRDACTRCKCNAGEVTCTTTSCPQVNIEAGCRAVPVFGKCCPQITCRDVHSCIVAGVEHLNGEQWNKDKCTTCRCDHGMMLCTKRTCPMPRPGCNYDLTSPSLNKCCGPIKCPKSPGYRKCTDKTTNVRYNHGEVWMRDSCTQCRCRHGYTKCNVFTCPTHVPTGCRTLNIEGQCCPHVLCDSVKVGQCPAHNPLMATVTVDMCGSDADCAGNSKCCNTQAARTCMSSVILERPGMCPTTQPTSGVLRKTCVTECTADSECTQDWKCCSDGGCSRICRPPVSFASEPTDPMQPIGPQEPSQIPDFNTKEGLCPKITLTRWDQTICLAECSVDTDCIGTKKCCSSGCRRTCVLPLPTNSVKKGLCPIVQPQAICQNNVDICGMDNECTGNKKCCYNGCHMECKVPDSPVVSCPVVAPTCNEVCAEGYATDPEGCEICSCARTCDPINAQTCNKECTFGYATDGRGCKICSCKNPSFPEQPAVKTTNGKPMYCEVLTSTTCLLTCVNGFKTDSLGCEICSCKQAPAACTPLTTCGLYCAYGLATNANGCEICQCKVPDMNKRYFNPIKTFCERPACYTQCPEGYATDSHGCDMRNCMCKRPVSDCPRMTPETCPERCPYGFATDIFGCEVCKCRLPVKCPDMSSCQETCIDTGFKTDNFGCKKCMCNPRPITQCPTLTIEVCPIKDMCAYGLATDNLGCPTCICKLPEATCPPMSCDLRCEFGFSTDKSGCEICKCKQSGSTCPVISNFNCKKVCPFGLATCTTGCEICACKKPVSKTSNTFHSKNMFGATCDPVTPQNCALTCTEGYATDFGCEICQCRQPEANCPALTDIACPMKLTCPYGLSSNSQGCPICECKQPISCSVNECTTECPYGYATDTQGCDICKCKLAPSATCKPMTIHTCQKMCSFGYATDVDGCEICACKQPSINTGITVSSSPLCEPLPNCQVTCTNGYATDNNGCEICSCKAPTSQCRDISYRICPQKTSCPYGLATNSDGCEICSCKIPATCPKVDRTNCDQRCDFGYATDTQGCEVCQCKIFNPRTCFFVNEFNCRISCPYGLATNPLGCEVCKCKLPPGQETYTVVSLRPDNRCPKDVLSTCNLTCPNGYATSMGCEVCRCKETGPQCTAVIPKVCPKMLRCQFGLQTNDQGCEVCLCRLPALCKPLKTCNVQCENGFATDKYGCEICECKAMGLTCIPVTNCDIAQNCENGLATDPVTRCEICSCKMPRAPTFYNEPNAGSKNVLIPEVKTCSYSPHRSCSLVCSNGFATDYKGCEICMCKVIDNTLCPVITEVVCPIMRRCEHGLATNTNGCSICACKAPTMCTPIDTSNCNLRCEYGYATDSYGCQTCACKSQSLTCVPVTSVTCPLTCTLGLATDSDGCEICKCRMPCVVKTLSFQVPTDAQPNAVIPQSRWIPNLRCFNLNKCLRTCPYGYVTNTMGCEICQCRKPPSQCQTVTVTNCPIKETCPYGLRTDVDGCEICSCKQPTPCSSLPSTKCTTVCLNGFATDAAGCPDFRSCKCKRSASSRVCDSKREEIRNCMKTCAYGYASNTFGCRICKCQQPTSKELSNKVTVSRTVFTTPNRLPTTFYDGVNSVDSVNCPLVNTESCTLTCDYGYATDSTGCTTCKCRSNPATCLEITADICPLVLTAKYGLATSVSGCDMCLARRPMTCNPVNNKNCANNCLYGHATDSFGCEVCNMCAKPPGECIGVPSTCQKNCNYGYATDPQGCPMCLCRNPPSFKTSRIVNFKPTTTPKTPTAAAPAPTCPDLNCALSCSQGYATDPTTGCGLCKCSALNCRERECAGKCPFGVVTNRKGCQTCTCKKPVTCQPLSQCNLNCPRGYATNVHGCEVCLCKKNFDVCPEPMCEIDETLRCSFGYATDANGCEICQCKMPVMSVIPINATPVKCTPLTGSTCSLSCPDGFATDATGCEICLCIKPATECGIAVTDCAIASTCPYGLATDDLGCTVCKCKMPSLCQPLPQSCNENCEFGMATNRFGCEKCACKEYSPGECPSLTSCTLNCPLGLASNNAGCEICKCKFPTSAMVTMVSELTPVQDPNLPTTAGVNVLAPASPCSPIQCFVHCPHGFVTDPVTGCEICECQTAPRFTCPAVPRTTHSMCVDFCASDSDCPPNAFCCSNGCGKTCLAATSNECIDENGVSHASGKVWNRDSCTRCSCNQGITSCSAFTCEPIPQGCQPFYITGQCCPSSNCPDKVCVNQGTWSEDTCTNCTCVDNSAVCTKQSCPEIKPGCTTEYVRGKCCPDMKCQGCRLANGQNMRNGETWNKDKCTTCRCENGNSVCSSTTCEQPKPGCKVVNIVNQCCPRIICLPEGSSTSAATIVGEQPCYDHQKTVPSINFLGFSIPITGHFNPSCTSNGFYEGKQCHTSTGFCWCADPFGVEIPNTRTQHGGLVCDQSTCIDYLGNQRIHGDKWKPDSCTTCTCESGQNACVPVECPVVPQGCVITSTAGCCPEFTCGDGCTVNGIHYGVGRYWNADNCQRCICQAGGQQQCVSRSCQVFSDPIPVGCQAVWTDDICCPRTVVCNGECPADKPRSTCITNPCDSARCPLNPNAFCRPHYCGGCSAVFYNVNNIPVKCTNCLSATGRMYLPGEEWMQGNCRLCACDIAGRSVCSNICQQPSIVANSRTCVDISGQVYYAGQKWNNTQCQTCTCEASGQITCQAKCSYSLTDPLPTGCSLIWTDDKCCPAQTVCNGRCPAEIGTTPCFMNPCRFARCPLNRAARCRSNFCGGCNAVFVDEENIPVKCTECVSSWGREYASGSMWIEDGCTECLCTRDGTKTCRAIQCPTTTDPIPDGCRLVPCTDGCCNLKVSCDCEVGTASVGRCNACATATCPSHPNAVCRTNTCNGCNAVFYDEFNKPVHCQYLSPLHNCPAGLAHMECFVNPCANAQCPAHPDALCRPNYCGTCHPEFFDANKQLVNCDLQPECARSCISNPCDTASCSDHPTAICRPNYCGGCIAEFFDENNRQVTCADCPPSKPQYWCFFNPCDGATCSNYPDALCRPNSCGGCHAEFYNINNQIVECAVAPVQQIMMTTAMPVQASGNPCDPMAVKYLTDPIVTSFNPRCTSDGYFSPKQCDGQGACWCTDPTGQQVTRYTNSRAQALNLECAQRPCHQALLEAQTYLNLGVSATWIPDCDSDGSFEEEQCNDIECWCVEPDGAKIPYSMKMIGLELNCDDICFGQLPSSSAFCTMNDMCDTNSFCHKLEGKRQGRCCKIPRN